MGLGLDPRSHDAVVLALPHEIGVQIEGGPVTVDRVRKEVYGIASVLSSRISRRRAGGDLDFSFIAEALRLTGIWQEKSCRRQTKQYVYHDDDFTDYYKLKLAFQHDPSS
jgi:hypothetical protein